jgi:hypothetical protein
MAVAGSLALAALVAEPSLAGSVPAKITSVVFSGSVGALRIVIKGQGFGSRPAAAQLPDTSSACRAEHAPGNEGQNFGSSLFFVEETSSFSAGLSGPYAGVADVIDCVGLVVKSYGASRVVYALGSDYTKHPYALSAGNEVMFVVDGARAVVKVRYGVTVPNIGASAGPRSPRPNRPPRPAGSARGAAPDAGRYSGCRSARPRARRRAPCRTNAT